MTVPVTLKESGRVEALLGCDETLNGRVTRNELIRPGKSVIGQVVAAALCDGVVDQTNERLLRVQDCPRIMIDVEIEYHAGITIPSPG